MFLKDLETEVVVLVGEIGGTKEEGFAKHYAISPGKSVAACIAGQAAPPGRKGHASANAFGATGTYVSKVGAFRKAGIPVAKRLSEVPELPATQLGSRRGGL